MGHEYQRVITESEAETSRFAAAFARDLTARDVVLLRGDLGLGKSVFCRALIRALCASEEMEIPSPTYTLVQTYDCPDFAVWHFDLYRLSESSEVYETGWEEALAGGVSLVEWPERLGSLLPAAYWAVTLSPVAGQPNHRQIRISRHDTRQTT